MVDRPLKPSPAKLQGFQVVYGRLIDRRTSHASGFRVFGSSPELAPEDIRAVLNATEIGWDPNDGYTYAGRVEGAGPWAAMAHHQALSTPDFFFRGRRIVAIEWRRFVEEEAPAGEYLKQLRPLEMPRSMSASDQLAPFEFRIATLSETIASHNEFTSEWIDTLLKAFLAPQPVAGWTSQPAAAMTILALAQAILPPSLARHATFSTCLREKLEFPVQLRATADENAPGIALDLDARRSKHDIPGEVSDLVVYLRNSLETGAEVLMDAHQLIDHATENFDRHYAISQANYIARGTQLCDELGRAEDWADIAETAIANVKHAQLPRAREELFNKYIDASLQNAGFADLTGMLVKNARSASINKGPIQRALIALAHRDRPAAVSVLVSLPTDLKAAGLVALLDDQKQRNDYSIDLALDIYKRAPDLERMLAQSVLGSLTFEQKPEPEQLDQVIALIRSPDDLLALNGNRELMRHFDDTASRLLLITLSSLFKDTPIPREELGRAVDFAYELRARLIRVLEPRLSDSPGSLTLQILSLLFPLPPNADELRHLMSRFVKTFEAATPKAIHTLTIDLDRTIQNVSEIDPSEGNAMATAKARNDISHRQVDLRDEASNVLASIIRPDVAAEWIARTAEQAGAELGGECDPLLWSLLATTAAAKGIAAKDIIEKAPSLEAIVGLCLIDPSALARFQDQVVDAVLATDDPARRNALLVALALAVASRRDRARDLTFVVANKLWNTMPRTLPFTLGVLAVVLPQGMAIKAEVEKDIVLPSDEKKVTGYVFSLIRSLSSALAKLVSPDSLFQVKRRSQSRRPAWFPFVQRDDSSRAASEIETLARNLERAVGDFLAAEGNIER